MKRKIIATIARAKFSTTTRIAARKQIVLECRKTVECVKHAGELAAKPTRVPAMLGVDEDMRDWSLYMILEHNAKANPAITRAMECLALQEPFESNVNPKTDYMPSEDPGEEQIAIFEESVEAHLRTLDSLGDLRKTASLPHPIFGDINAHSWNCVFGFHLMLHRRQAEEIVRILKKD